MSILNDQYSKEFFFQLGFTPCKAEQPLHGVHGVSGKRSTKRSKHKGNLLRKNLQLKDVC